ncbi:SusC/RagA family TonB-linked outer membrane protein [Labilibaculum sp.]|uniref:SusC/RagA family TonB-linked outer membrane protein n=1 Tax=Labilibaculum sp. TaxID=2060723 RepID=UPI002AA7075E|nr:SusC/RagA family TonB-linked outer membrane protein [Labilibaculum sp.]
MMKHIRIGMILFGLFFGFLFGVNAQIDTAKVVASDDDSLVHGTFNSVKEKDMPNGVSVLNPSEYLDKHYGTYPLDGTAAFVGGANLWNLGDHLVLIDGVQREIRDITATEIEQISFLKGANAIVLYGSRAANGVVLITTKRGKAGDKQMNVRVNAGLNMPKAYPEYLNSGEYMTFYNQARENDKLAALYSDEEITNYTGHTNTDRYPDVDYYSSDYLKKMYNTYSVNGDFSGGNDIAQFYLFGAYESNNSLLNFGESQNALNSRLSVRGNIDLKLNDYIKTYVNISTVYNSDKSGNGNYWEKAASAKPNKFSPLIPINSIMSSANDALSLLEENSSYLIDGNYLAGGNSEFGTTAFGDEYLTGYKNYIDRRFQYTSGVDIDLRNVIDGLSFHGQVSIDYINKYKQSVDNGYAVYEAEWQHFTEGDSIVGLTKHGKDTRSGNQNLSEQWNHNIMESFIHFDYKKTFNDKHNLDVVLLAAGARKREFGEFQSYTNANAGLQLSYNLDHKYYVDFSGSLVNSTKLSKDKRTAFSPTIGLGWVISEEGFLKGGIFDRLKLSATAGEVNTDLNFEEYYMYQGIYSRSSYYSWRDGGYQNQGFTPTHGENLDLGYVQRKELSFGVEALMLNQMLAFKANAFFIKKDGLPQQAYSQYPSYFKTYYPSGSFVPFINYGVNNYKGFDFEINYRKQFGEVALTIGAAGTYVKTKVLKTEEEFGIEDYRSKIGKPTDAIFGLQSDGFFMSDEEAANTTIKQTFGGELRGGDIKYVDQNGDNVIDNRDQIKLGTWGSPFNFGLNLTAEFKNFTLFVLGTGSLGGIAVKDNDYFWVYGDKKYSNVVVDSWTEETKNTATYPRLSTLSGANNFRTSDFWTYSTDRFDLAKVQLTYALPKSVLGSSFVKDVNIYVSGSNLLTLSKNKDILELNFGKAPQTRFYNLGVKAVF